MAKAKRVTLPQFIVDPEALREPRVVLRGPELHHLRVRRLFCGSELLLSDGRGTQRKGVVLELERGQAIISIMSDQAVQRESALRLVLAQAVLKADKMDFVVEKATELGIAELVFFFSERCIADPSAARQARWQRIAQSAAKQGQRSTVPAIAALARLEDVLARRETLRLLFWEGAGAGSLRAVQSACPAPASVLAIVGPEGGLSAAEAQCAAASGARLVSLGPRILRAETAAMVAATLIGFVWGDLGSETG